MDWYSKHSPPKLARLNLYNALINSPENAAKVEQSNTGAKERLGRPVAEFREANIYQSSISDPTNGSRHLMYEVDWALAQVFAAEADVEISHEKEVQRSAETLSRLVNPELTESARQVEIFERVKSEVSRNQENGVFINPRSIRNLVSLRLTIFTTLHLSWK